MPEFVLYDDGTVIYKRTEDLNLATFFTAKLTIAEKTLIIDKINSLDTGSFRDHYSIPGNMAVSDLPAYQMMFRGPDGSYKTVTTYGTFNEKAENEYRVQNVPRDLVDIFYFLSNYQNLRAVVFRPPFVEVIVWPFDGKSKKNVKWDKALPDLTDSKTVAFKQVGIQYHSIFVSESLEKQLAHNMWKLRKSKGALLMNGQRLNLRYRFPFPSERIWLSGSDGKMFRDNN